MSLTLKNYAKELPKELIQQVEKNTVRECDEIEKDHFVAYVDEGASSFDVSLKILPGGDIGKTTCDCTNNTIFCRHKTALLIHIAKDQKAKPIINIKKKASKVETLLDQVEFSSLKDWVKSLIEKNKDIELAFTHHFSTKKQYHTPEEVVKLIKDAIKATAGNKKTIDATQLKKLVELWTEVLQPVVAHYQLNVMEEKAFISFYTLVENCLHFHSGLPTNSNRIPKYVDDILQKSEAPINNLVNDEAWHKATGFFVAHIPNQTYGIRMHYLLQLQKIMVNSSAEKREKLIAVLIAQFKKSKPEQVMNGASYTKTLFGIIATYDLITEYYRFFKPLYFENEFNLKLIRLLIEKNQLELAEQYCVEQIKRNQREDYNVPYLALLKEIYTIQKNEVKLAGVLSILFSYTFNFNDYLFIIDRMSADEGKAWRTRMLRNARNASYSNISASEFPFKILASQQNYRKMIDQIDSHTPYAIILKYFEPMAAAHKDRFLSKIIDKSDNSWREKDETCFPELFDAAVKFYTADYLAVVASRNNKGNSYYYHANRFFEYMKERLNMRTVK